MLLLLLECISLTSNIVLAFGYYLLAIGELKNNEEAFYLACLVSGFLCALVALSSSFYPIAALNVGWGVFGCYRLINAPLLSSQRAKDSDDDKQSYCAF